MLCLLAPSLRASTVTYGNGQTDDSNYNTTGDPLTLTLVSGSAIQSGAITGTGSVTKTGEGTVSLTAANPYTGATFITEGTLSLQNTSVSSSFTIANGATLLQKGTTNANTTYTVGSGGILQFDYATGVSLDNPYSVVFNGSGTLLKTGAGSIGWGNAVAEFALGSGALIDVEGGILLGGGFANNSWTNNYSSLSVASGASFKGEEANVRVNALNGAGLISSGYTGFGYTAFTLGVGNGSGTFSGVLANGTGTGNFVKEGTGIQVLSGANTYTGATMVNAGTLTLQNTYTSPAFSVASGAVLQFDVATGTILDSSADATFSGSGTLLKTGAGTLQWATKSATFALGAGSLIDVEGGTFVGGAFANEVWTNNLSGLTVASGATFSGAEANVRVDALNGAGTIFSGFTGQGYQKFSFGVNNGSGSFSGVLAGSLGNYVKEGTGTQILSGNNTYLGSTRVNAGTLTLTGANTSSSYSIANGATLRQQGTTNANTTYTVDSGGILQFDYGTGVARDNPYSVVFNGNGTLLKTGAGSIEWNNAIAEYAFGSGAVIDVEAGTFKGGEGSGASTDKWTQNLSSLTVASGATFSGNLANVRVDALNGAGTISSGSTNAAYTGFTFGVNNGSGSFSGVLANGASTGNFIKEGSGTQVLSGASTYTGRTTVNGGTLTLQNTYASTAFSIGSGATLQFDVGTGTTLDSGNNLTLSGTGTLLKTGAGTLVWGSKATTFALGSGSLIDVEGGTFTGGSFANEVWTNNLSGLKVASGATFSGAEANVRVDALTGGGTIFSGFNGAGYQKFTFGVNNGSGSFSGVLAGSLGNYVKEGTGTQVLSGANTYAGSTTVNGGTLTLQNTYASPAFTIGSGAILQFDVATGVIRDSSADTNFTGSGTLLKTGAGTLQWSSKATTFALGSGSLIDVEGGTFTGGAFANEVWINNLSGLTVASGATFNGAEANVRVDALKGAGTITSGYNGAGYTAFTFGVDNGGGTFSGLLANSSSIGNFVKLGTGTQILTGNNTYTGSTTVTAGILQLGDGGTTGSISGPVTVNGTLAFNRSDSPVYSQLITGSGNLVQMGTGNLILTGASNSFAGTTTINAGASLQLGNNGTVGNISGAVTNNGTLIFNHSNAVQVVGAISGTGAVVSKGGGAILLGNSTYTGGTTIETSTLQVGNGTTGSITGDVLDKGTLIFFRNTDTSYGGAITGTGAFTKAGSGTLTITGNSSYSGGTTINGGSLQIGNSGSTGSITGNVVMNNGTAIEVKRQGTLTLAGNISGSGGIFQYGPGTLVLSGTNSYNYGVNSSVYSTVVNSGTLSVQNNSALGIGGVAVTGGTLRIEQGFSVANKINLWGGTLERVLGSGADLTGAVNVTSFNSKTNARILAGTQDAVSPATLTADFAGLTAANQDVFELSGLGTNLFVLQLSIANVTSGMMLGWLNGSNQWVNAVEGNIGNVATVSMQDFNGSYEDFLTLYGTLRLDQTLGAYGRDTDDGVVWAVLNHNSDFAVTTVPEPGTWTLLGLGLGLLVLASAKSHHRRFPAAGKTRRIGSQAP